MSRALLNGTRYPSKASRRILRAQMLQRVKDMIRSRKKHPSKVDTDGNVVEPGRPFQLFKYSRPKPTRATGALKRHERKQRERCTFAVHGQDPERHD